jgi:hypothetical protein
MKEILITLGSIVAILFGAILIYANVVVSNGLWDLEGRIYIAIGIVLFAAGVTGLWMKARLAGSSR